jgi:hypothetical protein
VGNAFTIPATIKMRGNTSGTVSVATQAAAGTYNFNLPTAAGSAGQPLLSGGGGAAAMTFGTLGVAAGGTGLTSGTSGGILGFTAAGTLASSVALTLNTLPKGGGAGATPTNSSISDDGTNVTMTEPVKLKDYAVGSLPTCDASRKFAVAMVNDANAACATTGFGNAPTGGGSTACPVYCDATSWKEG